MKNPTNSRMPNNLHSLRSIPDFPILDPSHQGLFIDGEDSRFPQNKSHAPIGRRLFDLPEQHTLIVTLRHANLRFSFDFH